jgi:hypothetical protein
MFQEPKMEFKTQELGVKEMRKLSNVVFRYAVRTILEITKLRVERGCEGLP